MRLAPVEFKVCGFPGCTERPLFRLADLKGWQKQASAAFFSRLIAAFSAAEKSVWRRICELDAAGLKILAQTGSCAEASSSDVKKKAVDLLNHCLARPDFFDPECFAINGLERTLHKLPARDRELRREVVAASDELKGRRNAAPSALPLDAAQEHVLACLNRFLLDCFCEGLLPSAPRTCFTHGSSCPNPNCMRPFNESRGRRITKDKLIAVDVDPAVVVRETRCHCPECHTYYKLPAEVLRKRLACLECDKHVLSLATMPQDLILALDGAIQDHPGEAHRAAALLDKLFHKLVVCPHCQKDLLVGKWCPLCHGDKSLPDAVSYLWVATNNTRQEQFSNEEDGHEGLVADPLDKHSYEKWLEESDATTQAIGE